MVIQPTPATVSVVPMNPWTVSLALKSAKTRAAVPMEVIRVVLTLIMVLPPTRHPRCHRVYTRLYTIRLTNFS